MAEYWKSTPKYWCKHCETFVVDTPLGKKNHEATGKHQGALKRFLRDIHRNSERAAQDAARAKSEVARLNSLVSGEGSSSSAAALSTVAKPEQKKGERWGVSAKPLSEEERRRQMQELEALGVALPETYRAEVAMPGEWQTISTTVEKVETEKERVAREVARVEMEEREAEERKRRWEQMDKDDREMIGFKIQTKTYPGAGAGEDDAADLDFGALFKKRKTAPSKDAEAEAAPPVKKEKTEEDGAIKREETEDGLKDMTEDRTEVKQEDIEDLGYGEDGRPIKKERRDSAPAPTIQVKLQSESAADAVKTPAADTDPPIKKEEGASGGVVFKKRAAKNIRKK